MNAIRSTGQVLAMEGQQNYLNVAAAVSAPVAKAAAPKASAVPTGSDVARSIAQNLAEVKASAEQMQKLSDMVMGRTLQFKVNQELGSVVINVVDPSTNQVIKEIPSEEMQTLKVRLKKAMGLLFDEMI